MINLNEYEREAWELYEKLSEVPHVKDWVYIENENNEREWKYKGEIEDPLSPSFEKFTVFGTFLYLLNRGKVIDKVTESVKEDLDLRSRVGVKKYKTTLFENTGDDYLNHLYEELLDAAQYIKANLMVKERLRDIIKNSANDAELAHKVREFVK